MRKFDTGVADASHRCLQDELADSLDVRRPDAVLGSLSGSPPARVKDEFEMKLRKLAKREVGGKPIEDTEPAERPSHFVNLLEALRESVGGRKHSATKRAPSARARQGKPRGFTPP